MSQRVRVHRLYGQRIETRWAVKEQEVNWRTSVSWWASQSPSVGFQLQERETNQDHHRDHSLNASLSTFLSNSNGVSPLEEHIFSFTFAFVSVPLIEHGTCCLKKKKTWKIKCIHQNPQSQWSIKVTGRRIVFKRCSLLRRKLLSWYSNIIIWWFWGVITVKSCIFGHPVLSLALAISQPMERSPRLRGDKQRLQVEPLTLGHGAKKCQRRA